MKNIASPGPEPTPVQSESSACTTGVMTISDTYVLKGHIQTERQNFFWKIERHFGRHMLAWGFGDFKGGEIFPWRNYPLRNCPRAKFPPPLYYQDGLRVVNQQCKMESISFAIPNSDSPPHCPPSPPPNTQSIPPPQRPLVLHHCHKNREGPPQGPLQSSLGRRF